MIDNLSPPGSYARFFAQRDGTPFTPLTEEALGKLQRCQAPDGSADELRGRGIINHRERV